MPRRLLVAAAVLAAATLTPTAAHAALPSIWAPVPSGTTQTITAIDYQSDARAWFTTAGGLIFRNPGTGFAQTGSSGGPPLADIAFRGAGDVGVAVGQGGKVLRSADGGATWGNATVPANVKDTCSAGASNVPTSAVSFTGVSFGDDATVYVVGDSASTQPVVLKSTDAGASFVDVNWGDPCKFPSGDEPVDVVASSATTVTVVGQSFGKIFRSFDGWATVAPTGEMINEFSGQPRIAVDPSNPSIVHAVDHSGPSNNCGRLCFQRSEAGGASSTVLNWLPAEPAKIALWDVDRAGGTLVAVGDDGLIATSADGQNVYQRPADPPLATQAWRAVSLSDANTALVGGTGGALVKSVQAGSVPDVIRPTVTLNGPNTVYVGQPATFTAAVSDTGGSGVDLATQTWSGAGLETRTGASATYTFTTPGSFTLRFDVKDNAGNAAEQTTRFISVERPTGGAEGSRPLVSSLGGGNAVTIFRTVTVTGKASRFIPVRMKANGKRTFKLKLYRGTGPKRAISSKTYTFRKKGVRLGRLALPATAGPGTYRVEVAVYKGSKRVGKRVTKAVVVV